MTHTKELIKYAKELSILFVEDHDELRENTSEILNSFFKNVSSAENGEVALELYKQSFTSNSGKYDIILSDIKMPKINGVELTKKVYQLNDEQLIIIMSAYDDSKYLLPLINLGIEQFIKKPIDFQELLEVLLNTSKKISTSKNKISTPLKQKIMFNKEFLFDKSTSSLYKNDESIYLTKFEMIFLKLLTESCGKIYSNYEITDYYNILNEKIDAQNIRKLVSKLRKKLPKNAIESIYGVGYKVVVL